MSNSSTSLVQYPSPYKVVDGNGYHRYGKKNCPPHRIRETELDEIICGEITNVKEQAAQLYENIDDEVRKWLKKKSTVTGKIRQLNAELEQKKERPKRDSAGAYPRQGTRFCL